MDKRRKRTQADLIARELNRKLLIIKGTYNPEMDKTKRESTIVWTSRSQPRGQDISYLLFKFRLQEVSHEDKTFHIFYSSLCSSPARISRLQDSVFNQGKILGFFRRFQVIW
ncbi:uncharacterized protein LOC114969632 isoform X1 [Acropora millepora]|uniref:uncharacterized protein LOC114969632 isoform X1 n=1 Tax=Acropora millepora TaxID=45264 RepID=UPI001CF33AFA|nr:uncharacterized protein LOC114969632 isoform X1 [Acropora millepora]XP_044183709.1 uncharacterized protein LOC114969632 isoform X1 [Acropora millepora]XP_044183710.1 uncharacterized protein LOC114969632 isoform X1 [Acropora millepora]